MDWSKSKNILILLLLITNAVLLYSFVSSDQSDLSIEREDIITLYRQRNIHISAEEATPPVLLPSVKTKLHIFTRSDIAEKLGIAYQESGNEYYRKDRAIHMSRLTFLYSYVSDFEAIKKIVFGDSLLTPSDGDRLIQEPESKRNALYQQALDYLVQEGVPYAFRLRNLYASGEYTIVELGQYVGNYDFEESKVFVFFRDDILSGYFLERIGELFEEKEEGYHVVPYEKMLFHILPQLENGESITFSGIVYRLSDPKIELSDIVEGESFPYYKIVTSQKEIYTPAYVEEFIE